jgi:hypothetical protein
LTQEQVAQKLYGVKTIETVSGKFPLSQNQNDDASVLPTIESEEGEGAVKFFLNLLLNQFDKVKNGFRSL